MRPNFLSKMASRSVCQRHCPHVNTHPSRGYRLWTDASLCSLPNSPLGYHFRIRFRVAVQDLFSGILLSHPLPGEGYLIGKYTYGLWTDVSCALSSTPCGQFTSALSCALSSTPCGQFTSALSCALSNTPSGQFTSALFHFALFSTSELGQ